MSVLGALIVTGLLAFVLAWTERGVQRRPSHRAASLLALAVLLQIVALVARSEAWNGRIDNDLSIASRNPLGDQALVRV